MPTAKKAFPYRIYETQPTFVIGRQITNNIMISQDMFHALRTILGGMNKRLAIKTDMSKAYDIMKWVFFRFVMQNGESGEDNRDACFTRYPSDILLSFR